VEIAIGGFSDVLHTPAPDTLANWKNTTASTPASKNNSSTSEPLGHVPRLESCRIENRKVQSYSPELGFRVQDLDDPEPKSELRSVLNPSETSHRRTELPGTDAHVTGKLPDVCPVAYGRLQKPRVAKLGVEGLRLRAFRLLTLSVDSQK